MRVGGRTSRSLIIVACLAALSCGEEEPAVAKIGDRAVELSSFQSYVSEASGEAWQVANARVASRLLDQYLDRIVLLETARNRGVLEHSDTDAIGPTELRWLMDELCGRADGPDPNQVRQEVAARMEQSVPARAHVRQILVDTLDEAVAARRRLEAGEDFVAISREVSRAANADSGGELGFVNQESLPPEIDDVVFSLASGAISQPVQGTSGYHVFQVLEVVPAGSPDRAQVEVEVRAELAQQAARDHTRVCVRKLADEIGVRVNPSLLWFPYHGRYAEVVGDA